MRNTIMTEETLLKEINRLLTAYEHKLAKKDVSVKAYLCWIKEDERYCTMPDQIDAVILTVDFIYKHQPENNINLCLTMAYDDVENVAQQTYEQMKKYIRKYSGFIIKRDYQYALKQYNINIAKLKKFRKFLKRQCNLKNLIIVLVASGIIIIIIDIIRRFIF